MLNLPKKFWPKQTLQLIKSQHRWRGKKVLYLLLHFFKHECTKKLVLSVDAVKRFLPSQTLGRNKLDRLSISNFFYPSLIFGNTDGSIRVQDLLSAALKCMFLSLSANVRLGWVCFSRAHTLAYFNTEMKKKWFQTLTSEVNFINILPS
jgi:hypothetical protein